MTEALTQLIIIVCIEHGHMLKQNDAYKMRFVMQI